MARDIEVVIDTSLPSQLARLRRENERLRDALLEAVEFAEEGWTYASDYFRTKWDFAERHHRLRGIATSSQGSDK